MSEKWTERQRRTNQLGRILGTYLLSKETVTPRQIYGLSKLSWITSSYEDDDAAYIQSTKIPALGDIFEENYSSLSLNDVAAEVSNRLDSELVGRLILRHTGFTNFYKAYRNSVSTWIEANHSRLLPMYRAALQATNNGHRLRIIQAIQDLPGISKANHEEQRMRPEYFLTPAFFILDPEVKFPLINGNAWVKNLLDTLKVRDSGLDEQYLAMVGLYGVGGINDAADLDQVGRDSPDFITTETRTATKQLLQSKQTENNVTLPLKDEADVESIRKAGSIAQRRIHNRLTNLMRSKLSGYTLLEGRDPACMFDVLVKKYNDEVDLLIEVKSSIEVAHVRMAVGQLFDYRMRLKATPGPHLAILLPARPEEDVMDLLIWLEIGLMWFEGDALCTEDVWLAHLQG